MIVTAHQPNLLPGMSVISKILAADTVIWLDEVLYSPGGFTNRNRMPDGSWLTVPVESGAGQKPINRVGISEHGNWRDKASRTVRQQYRGDWCAEVCEILHRPYRLLVGLNVALLQVVFRHHPQLHLFQSHLDGGRAVTAVSDDRAELAPISVRLAMMTEEAGGDVYLSGPSGRNYLDERPFTQRGIRVDYWQHTGPNPCALAMLEALSVR
jgi:WbqC-like protein